MSLGAMMLSERSQTQRATDAVGFHVYDTSRTGQQRPKGGCGGPGLGEQGQRVTANGCKVSSRGEKNVLKWILVMVTRLHKYISKAVGLYTFDG